jgi:hypothetical protein
MAATFTNKVVAYLESKGKTKKELSLSVANVEIQDDKDGNGPYIKVWKVDGVDKPTVSQLNALESTADTLGKNNVIRGTRRNSYGDIGDQLDLLYKDIVANKLDTTGEWAKKIKAVKDANAKE